jgi:hypothetical protein
MSEQSKDSNPRPHEERRESPRVSMRLRVKRADSADSFEAREGNLSLGGFAWFSGAQPVGSKIEVRISLPDAGEELQLRGEVIHVAHGSRGTSAHARFLELPVEAELRIARYLDDVELEESNARSGS